MMHIYNLTPPDDEHNSARNMQRNTIDLVKKLCIKLANKTFNVGTCVKRPVRHGGVHLLYTFCIG